MTHQRFLLSSVFGRYGVEGPYASAGGMQMEPLNNQVTREQGIHSPRAVGALSYGLASLAQYLRSWVNFRPSIPCAAPAMQRYLLRNDSVSSPPQRMGT